MSRLTKFLAAAVVGLTFAVSGGAASMAASGAKAASGATSTSGATAAPLPGFDIRIVPGSVIHLVSRNSKLPISIQNNYNTEIRVQVHVAANNLNALIPAAIEVTVPANTTYVAQVPVSAIADGPVTLKAWITTFSGLSLGAPVNLPMTINAEIEESIIAGFAIVVSALGIVGVIRTIRRRKTAAVDQN
jgi:hypothetical protein